MSICRNISIYLSVFLFAAVLLTALPIATHAATPVTWKNGSLTASMYGSASAYTLANAGKSSGKWYWEVTVDSDAATTLSMIGISNEQGTKSVTYYGYSGYKYDADGTSSKYGATYGLKDTISIALDIDSNTIEWYKNGVTQGVSKYAAAAIQRPFYAAVVNGSHSGTRTFTANFGATPFKYPMPAGYTAYNEANSAPVIGQSTLQATAGDTKVDLGWSAAANAKSYNVKRSTTAGGPYTTIAQSVTANVYNELAYTDVNVANGTTYYYTVAGLNGTTEGALSNEATATPIAAVKPNEQATLDVTIDKDKVKVGEEFVSNLSLKNVKDIYAEDFVINYDASLMQYLGYTEVPGYKVYNETNDQKGTLRFIVASQGKNYGISSDTIFLKLKFKAVAAGTGKVDSLSGKIADTDKEYDIDPANALEDTILIEKPSFLDVNRSGEYTLLDLSIDAFYFGQTADSTNKDLYDADQTEDNQIGDDDLVYIVGQMLTNPNYSPNK